MPRRRHVLQTGAAGLALLAGCARFSSGASESVTRTVDPGDAGTVSTFTPNGRITIHGTDTTSVRVDAVKRTTSGSEELDAVRVVAAVVADAVVVRVEKTTQQWPQVTVDLDIEIPATLVTTGVRTGNGDVDLTNTRGATTVETGNGAITLTDHAGYPQVTSGNGDITTTGGGPGVRRAWTGNGSVDAEVRDIQDTCSLGSGNGDLTARVGDDLACALELDTGSGTVDTGDLPVSTQASWRGHLSGSLRGGGERRLQATTGNGDVTLRPLE